MRSVKAIELDEAAGQELRALSRSRRVEARLKQRADIVLLAAQGLGNTEIGSRVDLDRRQVAIWRQRFLDCGVDALRRDAPRSGRLATVDAQTRSRIVQLTLHETPPNATHWSTRTLAAHTGVGATLIRKIWRDNGLKPHLSRTFKLSRDPNFEDKLLDVVGLYLVGPA